MILCKAYKGLDKIVYFEILDLAHPAFDEPALGVLVENQFYYIANSQWGGYNEDHGIKPVSDLMDIVILKCRID